MSEVSSTIHNGFDFATNCGVPWFGDPVGLLNPESIVLYIFALIWLLFGIRVVSDEYFAVSIEGMIHAYKIPHSVAGATLMAVGASTPELLASFIGVFIAAESATGAGTVIGSIIFNHLCIIGACILASPGKTMEMKIADMFRDVVFYALAIILFVIFFQDEQVDAWESWIMCGAYFVYAFICAYWVQIEPYVFRLFKDPRGYPNTTPGAVVAGPVLEANAVSIDSSPIQDTVLLQMPRPPFMPQRNLKHIHNPYFKPYDLRPMHGNRLSAIAYDGSFFRPRFISTESNMSSISASSQLMFDVTPHITPYYDQPQVVSGEHFQGHQLHIQPQLHQQPMTHFIYPQVIVSGGHMGQVTPPVKIPLMESSAATPATVTPEESMDVGHGHDDHHEDDRVWRNPWTEAVHVWNEGSWTRKIIFAFESFWVLVVWAIAGGFLRSKKWWFPLFVLGLSWLILQCVYLTYWLEKSACVIGVTAGAMGTILGAAGTSIPNLLCSVYVARKGQAVMACTEVWGSNIFDILFALGFPWGLYSSLSGKPVKVHGSTSLSIWMGLVYLVFFSGSIVTGWKYNRWHGYIMIFIYIVFIIFIFCNEAYRFASRRSVFGDVFGIDSLW